LHCFIDHSLIFVASTMDLARRVFVVAFVSFAFATGAAGQAWPITATTSDMLPNIEVSLAPPAQPYPQAQASIGGLDKSREAFEADQMGELRARANAALHDAKRRISESVARALRVFDGATFVNHVGFRSSAIGRSRAATFLGFGGGDAFAFKINVQPATEPTDQSINDSFDAIERARHDLEQGFFHQASKEMSALTDTVLAELEAHIQANVNAAFQGRPSVREMRKTSPVVFLETVGSPEQANVRVVPPSAAYPTVGALVQDMENRRDISERLEHAFILDLELDLLEAENAYAEEALKAGIGRVLAAAGAR